MDMLTQLFDRLGYRGAAQQATPVVFGKLALDQLAFTPLHVLSVNSAAQRRRRRAVLHPAHRG